MLEVGARQKYSIDEWDEEFTHIYGNVDRKRKPAEMWLLMMEDASHFAESIRREKYGRALNNLAHVFCWACSFVSRCRIDEDKVLAIEKPLSQIVWDKYPNACCLCGHARCICSVRRAELEELTPEQKAEVDERVFADLASARARVESRPATLDGFSDMFGHIYKGAHYNLPIEAIVLHFMEEVGEVSTCIRKIRERQPGQEDEQDLGLELEREVEDIISWISSSLSKLDYIRGAGKLDLGSTASVQTANLTLSAIVWDAFKDESGAHLWCPQCKERPCNCVPRDLYGP